MMHVKKSLFACLALATFAGQPVIAGAAPASAATEANLDWAIELEADRMVNSFIRKSDLDSEMTVVRNELERGENSPSGILMERILSTAFLWHNYGKDTIGARADLEAVPIDRL